MPPPGMGIWHMPDPSEVGRRTADAIRRQVRISRAKKALELREHVVGTFLREKMSAGQRSACHAARGFRLPCRHHVPEMTHGAHRAPQSMHRRLDFVACGVIGTVNV